MFSIHRQEAINSFSNEIFENIFRHLTDDQIKKSCLTVNRQWNTCASKGLCLLFDSIPSIHLNEIVLVLQSRSPIHRIPNEILLRIFKYHLNPYDLFHSCLSVNQKWKKIIEDQSMWKSINPINWARGSFVVVLSIFNN